MTSVQTSKEKLRNLINSQGEDALPPVPAKSKAEEAASVKPAIPAFETTRPSQKKEPVLGLENQINALLEGDLRYCVGPGYTTEGELVRHVQKLLNLAMPSGSIRDSGKYDEDTRKKIFAFQIADARNDGLCALDKPDGIVGPNTLMALESEVGLRQLRESLADEAVSKAAAAQGIKIATEKVDAAGRAIARACPGSGADIASITAGLLSLNLDEIQSLKERWNKGEFRLDTEKPDRQPRSLEKTLKRVLKGDLEESVLTLLNTSTPVQLNLDSYKSEVCDELRRLAYNSKLEWIDVVHALEPGGQLQMRDRVEYAREIRQEKSIFEFMRYIESMRKSGSLDQFIETYGRQSFARDTSGSLSVDSQAKPLGLK